jgi:cytoplasmic iron level regulating protein YaaA (DUF328/UPF0246 family)
MLILLPPSETKRAGGSGSPIDVGGLALPALAPQREAVVDALVALSDDEDNAARVLKLSDRQRSDIAVNAALRSTPTLPAVDRYTGVLYDALDADSLPTAARRWLGAHVLIHSAPFGPVGALDRIPAYRLAAGTSLPDLPPMRRHWAGVISAALVAEDPRFILDLRSEAYTALGPIPAGIRSRYVRVVTEAEGGAVRALNHFNKHAKGAFVRALATSRPRVGSPSGLRAWADAAGWTLCDGADGEWDLVV